MILAFLILGIGCGAERSGEMVETDRVVYEMLAGGDSLAAVEAVSLARQTLARDSAGGGYLTAEGRASRARLKARVGYGLYRLGDRAGALRGYYRASQDPDYPDEHRPELVRSWGEVIVSLSDDLSGVDTVNAVRIMDAAYAEARARGDADAARKIGACRDRLLGPQSPPLACGSGGPCAPTAPDNMALLIAALLLLSLGWVGAGWRIRRHARVALGSP